eukprot:scaffold4588_cov62-Phaeocystis_antarctica.AAC.7
MVGRRGVGGEPQRRGVAQLLRRGAASHLQDARDAKVAELGRAVAAHEDVLRLEVAVQHAHLVHVLEPCGKLDEPVHQLFLWQLVLPFRLGFLPPPGEHRAQVAASRQLHQDADRPRLRKPAPEPSPPPAPSGRLAARSSRSACASAHTAHPLRGARPTRPLQTGHGRSPSAHEGCLPSLLDWKVGSSSWPPTRFETVRSSHFASTAAFARFCERVDGQLSHRHAPHVLHPTRGHR